MPAYLLVSRCSVTSQTARVAGPVSSGRSSSSQHQPIHRQNNKTSSLATVPVRCLAAVGFTAAWTIDCCYWGSVIRTHPRTKQRFRELPLDSGCKASLRSCTVTFGGVVFDAKKKQFPSQVESQGQKRHPFANANDSLVFGASNWPSFLTIRIWPKPRRHSRPVRPVARSPLRCRESLQCSSRSAENHQLGQGRTGRMS